MIHILDLLNTAIYTGFGAVTLWTYYGLFLQNRAEGKLRLFCWEPFLVWQCLWSYLSSVGIYTPIFLNMGIYLLSIFLVAVLGYESSVKTKMIFAVSYLLLTTVSEEIVWYGVQFFCAPDTNITAWWPPLLARVISFVAILALYFMLRKRKLVEADDRANIHLLIFSLGNTFVAYSVILAYERLGQYGDKLIATLTISILLGMTIFAYQIYGRLRENMELEQENEKYSYQLELFLQHQREREENEREIRRYRHDMKQKLTYLKGLADASQSEEISRFLQEELNIKGRTARVQINTGNLLIDALFNDKNRKALNAGIRFETWFDVPEHLPYKDSDLCVIFGNLLDNACEAAQMVQDSERYIKTNLLFDVGNLIFTIENSFDGTLHREKGGGFLSRKADSKDHGIGLKSVKKIAEKYKGDVYIENLPDIFRVKVVLYEYQK